MWHKHWQPQHQLLSTANQPHVVPLPQADIADFAKVNGVYARFFTDKPPARATFAVKDLPAGARVEIDAIAVLP